MEAHPALEELGCQDFKDVSRLPVSRLPQGQMWMKPACAQRVPSARAHMQLLFLTPWVRIPMVTAVFVYLTS